MKKSKLPPPMMTAWVWLAFQGDWPLSPPFWSRPPMCTCSQCWFLFDIVSFLELDYIEYYLRNLCLMSFDCLILVLKP